MVDWLVDTREPNKPGKNICDELRDLGLTTERQQLEVGDFISYDCDDEIIIVSRKAGDLFTSVFDGHFSDELNRSINLIESLGGGGHLFWLQEGIWTSGYPSGKGGMHYFERSGPKWFRASGNHNGASENVLPNVELSLWAAGIGLVTSFSLHETALMLAAIYNRGQQGWPSKLTSALKRPTLRWSEDSRIQRLMALIPHLNEQVAGQLLHDFGTIGGIIDIAKKNPEKLLETKGFGKKGLANLQNTVFG